jgi:DNA-binding PadR family transcriptional regulator
VGFFKYGELPLVILALLARGSLNGYELIGALERTFRPHYVPSPGSVYPALAALEREELVAAEEHDGARTYSLTEGGAKALTDRHEQLSQVELRTGTFLRDDDVFAELARLDSVLRSAQNIVDPAVLQRIVRKARTSAQALLDEGDE